MSLLRVLPSRRVAGLLAGIAAVSAAVGYAGARVGPVFDDGLPGR
jgi:hypothetical protein